MFNIGFSELILILLIAFLVVGPKDLPKVARWLGRNVRRGREMMKELKAEVGWDALEEDAASVKKEIDQTVKENDIVSDVRSVSADLQKHINEAKKLTKK